MRLPKCVLAKPHCGEKAQFSRGTNFAAASMRRFSLSFDSASASCADEAQRDLLFFGTKRSGSKPPARSVSYSEKESVHGGPAEYRFGYRVGIAEHPHAHVIAAAGVHGDAERHRALGDVALTTCSRLRGQLVRVFASAFNLGADVLVDRQATSRRRAEGSAAGGGEVADLLAVGGTMSVQKSSMSA